LLSERAIDVVGTGLFFMVFGNRVCLSGI